MKAINTTPLRYLNLTNGISPTATRPNMLTFVGEDGSTVVLPDPEIHLTDCDLESRNLRVRVTVEILDPPKEPT